MLNALIISYYYPPHNGVAGWRPYSWAQHFYKNGIHPTVLTRHWEGNENTWADSMKENSKPVVYEKNTHATVIYLPYEHSRLGKIIFSPLFKIPGFSKIYHLLMLLSGRIAIEIDAYHSFKKFLRTYLKAHRFDMIIVTAPPHNLVRLGYVLRKKFNIPVIIDFRDIWNNDELKMDYAPSISQRIKNFITRYYMRRWLKSASFVTTVSDSLAKKLGTITRKKIYAITNGFEKELFAGKNQFPSTSLFTLSIIGTIYPKQDLTIMLDGLNKFIATVGKDRVRLNFIGIESIAEVSEKIKKSLPQEVLYTSPRLSRESAIDHTLASHVLLYAGWKDYKGIYSGKIFDYLGAKRNILIAPGDGDVIDHIVRYTNAGKTANSSQEFNTILMQWFEEWEQHGTLAYHGIEERINNYSRESQVELLANHITNFSVEN